MKNQVLSDNLIVNRGVKAFKRLQYWLAAVSYLIVFALSILCLVVYLPHLSEGDALDKSTLNILNAMLIILLIVGTAAFGWETLQWRRGRVKKDQPSIEDIIKDINKDSNNNH